MAGRGLSFPYVLENKIKGINFEESSKFWSQLLNLASNFPQFLQTEATFGRKEEIFVRFGQILVSDQFFFGLFETKNSSKSFKNFIIRQLKLNIFSKKHGIQYIVFA